MNSIARQVALGVPMSSGCRNNAGKSAETPSRFCDSVSVALHLFIITQFQFVNQKIITIDNAACI